MWTPELEEKSTRIRNLLSEKNRLESIINHLKKNKVNVEIGDNFTGNYINQSSIFSKIVYKHFDLIKEEANEALNKITDELENLIK